jgi:hypothetical protein
MHNMRHVSKICNKIRKKLCKNNMQEISSGHPD